MQKRSQGLEFLPGLEHYIIRNHASSFKIKEEREKGGGGRAKKESTNKIGLFVRFMIILYKHTFLGGGT